MTSTRTVSTAKEKIDHTRRDRHKCSNSARCSNVGSGNRRKRHLDWKGSLDPSRVTGFFKTLTKLVTAGSLGCCRMKRYYY